MTDGPTAGIEGTLHSVDGTGVVRMVGRFGTDADDLWSAITDPQRLAQWYGSIDGELRVGGEFTAVVFASGWDGRGRVEQCDPPSTLRLSMWEGDSPPVVVAVELVADGDDAVLVVERRGVPLDLLWAYGAGWHEHLEDLATHVAGRECASWSTRGDARFDALAPTYREMPVLALDR